MNGKGGIVFILICLFGRLLTLWLVGRDSTGSGQMCVVPSCQENDSYAESLTTIPMIHDWAVCSPEALKNHFLHLHTIPAADRDIQTVICRTEAHFASMKWESNQLYIVWETFKTWSLSKKHSSKNYFICVFVLFFHFLFVI